MLVWGFFRVALGFLAGLFVVVDFPFSPGFLDPPPGFRGVTDSLLLTFCFSIMVSLLPLLVCSGD